MKVLVSTSSFGKADPAPLDELKSKCEVKLNPYGRKLTTEEFADLTEDVCGVIAGVEQITREVLSKRPNIKVISRCGVGMDSVDREACADLGIKLTNTPEAPVASVAELTVTVMLDLIKNVSNMNASVKSGKWNKMTGLMLSGKKVGIIGFGRIGRRVSELLEAFGAEVGYTDIEKKDTACRFMEKAELLKWADIVTIHSSFCEEGEYIIGAKELELMKGGFLVNTSRGRFVDEDALYAALSSGSLAGAALDVFEKEPYEGKLSELENVILTPHVASSAKEGRAVMEMEAVRNLFEGLGI
ncbi:MAG: phosphoglycerate dehydrogenase [Lachnospiraceae bacterium]|nr:phosphoglycerate dehydrogenase [Lachnospiraceae bacterium]